MYITIAEFPEYIRRAEKLLSDKSRKELINFLAVNPEAGIIMKGTGGLRNFVGRESQQEKAVASESYTIFTTKICRYF